MNGNGLSRVEPVGCDLRLAREEIDAANDPPTLYERVRQTQAGEHFERAGFHHRRPVPAERLWVTVDEVQGYAATRELDREHEPGRTGADDENRVFWHDW
jgi:hypothetical protein